MNERVLWNGLPTIVMMLVQFGFAGVNIFYKLAAADGMSFRIIIAYRFLFASAFILPIAFFLERYLILPFFSHFLSPTQINCCFYFILLFSEVEDRSLLGPLFSMHFFVDSLGN